MAGLFGADGSPPNASFGGYEMRFGAVGASRGRTFYWEHLGLLDHGRYADEWKRKKDWYECWFPGQLLTTEEGPHMSRSAEEIIAQIAAETPAA
jgi:hypothetical protein